MKKQNIAIIGVIAFVLAVAVGYALFSETLTVNGTAKAKGSFDYAFTQVGPVTSKNGYTPQIPEGKDAAEPLFTVKPSETGAAIAVDETTGVVANNNGNYLQITVDKLDYPGAYVEIPVTVKNVGTINGKLKNINETGINDANTMIKVTYSGIAASDTVIAPGDTQTMTIRVEWPENYTFPEGATSNEVSETVSFGLSLEYEQVNS